MYDFEEEFPLELGYSTYTTNLLEETASKKYSYYLEGEIGPPEGYLDLIQTLRSLTEDDTLYIYINSLGGQLSTGLQIINAIIDCKGKVVTVLDCEAYSMASFILLTGDQIHIPETCCVMLHNFSAAPIGKGHELGSELAATNQIMASLMQKYGSKILTEDEIDRVIRGEDIYFTNAQEIADRLQGNFT